MATPLPADYQALITNSSAPLCERFKTLIESLPPELYNLVNFMFTSTGGITEEFSNLIQQYANSDPIGTVKAFAGTSLPDGYLWCDGASYQKNSKTDLFGVIGYSFTPGYSPGQASFKVPNLNNRFIMGADGTTVVPGDSNDNDYSVLTAALFNHYHVLGYKITDVNGSGQPGAAIGSNGISSPSGENTVLTPAGKYEVFKTTSHDEEDVLAEDVDLEPGNDQAERLQSGTPWDDSGRISDPSDDKNYKPSYLALRFIIKE